MDTARNNRKNKQQAQDSLSFRKKALFSFISIIFVIVMLFLVCELAFRLLLPMGKFRSAQFRRYDPVIGISLIPNLNVKHSRGCFTGQVVTNEWGFRDRSRILDKPTGEYRIALVGDSIVEGAHVKPEEVMNIQMEQMLQQRGYNVEVMNFGIGGLGTTQELILYKEHIRQFHPDLVVLIFSQNDIVNNSSTLQPKMYGIHDWFCPYYDVDPDGSLVFRPAEHRTFNGLISFGERHSVSVYYFERLWSRINLPLDTWHGLSLVYGVYSNDPLDMEWQNAWTVTENVLHMLNQAVQEDGGRLLVLVGPKLEDIDVEWKQRLIKQYKKPLPPELNLDRFDERMRQISARQDVPIDFLAPYMQQYRDEHHLQWPYFSLRCDPHFSAFGHEIAAQAINQKLEQYGLLPTNRTPARAQAPDSTIH